MEDKSDDAFRKESLAPTAGEFSRKLVVKLRIYLLHPAVWPCM